MSNKRLFTYLIKCIDQLIFLCEISKKPLRNRKFIGHNTSLCNIMRLRLELGHVVSYRITLHVHQNNFNLSGIAKEKLK